MSKESPTTSTFREAFDELIACLNDACLSADKLTTEKNVDTLNDLRFDFYSNMLEVSDAVKDMLKGFRKKHKMTEKEVRSRMSEEEEAGVDEAAEDGAAEQEPEEVEPSA